MVFQVKFANYNKLFLIENMDRLLIKWYFGLLKWWEILYRTKKKSEKKSRQARKMKNLCQSHNLQYIKLKENSNFKMKNLDLQRF